MKEQNVKGEPHGTRTFKSTGGGVWTIYPFRIDLVDLRESPL